MNEVANRSGLSMDYGARCCRIVEWIGVLWSICEPHNGPHDILRSSPNSQHYRSTTISLLIWRATQKDLTAVEFCTLCPASVGVFEISKANSRRSKFDGMFGRGKNLTATKRISITTFSIGSILSQNLGKKFQMIQCNVDLRWFCDAIRLFWAGFREYPVFSSWFFMKK